jgi:ATP-dependent RNA helicase RhlE
LPVIDLIIKHHTDSYLKALVIVPTRELATQIDQAIQAYSYFTGISSMAIYGGGDGQDFNQERKALTTGTDIIIATPGRLNSHLNLGYVDFSKLEFLILDEADRMLDMGFMPDLQRIIRQVNPNRQSLLFSATMPDQIFQLARTLLKDPVTVNIALSKPAEGVTQGAYVVHDDQKVPLIVDLLQNRQGQCIVVFTSTKSVVNILGGQLLRKGLKVGQISSDFEQDQREQVMQDFQNRKIDILVATDVISRGIDVAGIELVINFDVPNDAEDYVHRVGRTGRAEKKGEAITFIAPAEQYKFKKIEILIGSEVKKLEVPEKFGPTPAYDPKVSSGRPGGGGGQKPFRKGGRPPFKRNGGGNRNAQQGGGR